MTKAMASRTKRQRLRASVQGGGGGLPGP
jgi:hypothetical protein